MITNLSHRMMVYEDSVLFSSPVKINTVNVNSTELELTIKTGLKSALSILLPVEEQKDLINNASMIY